MIFDINFIYFVTKNDRLTYKRSSKNGADIFRYRPLPKKPPLPLFSITGGGKGINMFSQLHYSPYFAPAAFNQDELVGGSPTPSLQKSLPPSWGRLGASKNTRIADDHRVHILLEMKQG
jgi:hypothetical protein